MLGLFTRRKEILSDTERKRLAMSIAEAEKTTSGEVRISVQAERQLGEAMMSVQDLALDHFKRLGMTETRDKTGVLIYLLVSEHKLQILADAGINEKVNAGTWQAIADSMTAEFKAGRFYDGLSTGLEKIGAILTQHFPVQPGDRNELSNDIEMS